MISEIQAQDFFDRNRYQKYEYRGKIYELWKYVRSSYILRTISNNKTINVNAATFIKDSIYIIPSQYNNACGEVPLNLPESTIIKPDFSPHKVETKKEIDNTDYFEHILDTCYNVNVHTNS